jgi:AraC-like DNA-binding protein
MSEEYTVKDYQDFDLSVSAVDFALSKMCPLNYLCKIRKRSLYGLVLILEGTAEFFFPDQTFYAEKNNIVFVKKGESYQFYSRGEENLEFNVISFDILPNAAAENFPFERLNKVSHPKRFEDMFRYVEDLWYEKSIGYKFQARSLVQSLMYELLQEAFKKQVEKNGFEDIQTTVQYMEDCFDKVIRVENLAEISGYSPTQYRKKFKQIYGMTPVQYLNALRVQKAKDMLRCNLYSTKEIALRCGFGNIYYFGRLFKKITGYSPGKY